MNDLSMEETIAKLQRAVSRTISERRLLVGALQVALEYIEDQEDTVDGPEGEPMANTAMRIATDIREALHLVGAQP